MGGSFSKSNAVWVQTDKPAYFDGDFISAAVCLNIVTPVTITTVDCQLTAVERTYWTEHHESGSGDSRHTWTTSHGGTMQLLNVTHPLAGAGRTLGPGQYQWAVVFALPPGVPSSFKIGSGYDGGDVTYAINIVFHTPGMFASAIRTSQHLAVRQRMQAPLNTVDQSAELQLVSCCCIKRGMVKAHVRLEQDKCQPGEEVQVMLEVDNRSNVAIKSIEVCLKREVLAFERPGRTGGNRHHIHKEFVKTKHPGIQPYTALEGSMARRIQLRLPDDLAPSMHGALISCDYFVKVKLNIGSLVKDVKMKVPVIVLAPQPVATEEEPFYTEPPLFWKPNEVQMPEGIHVPSAAQLPPELLKPDAPFWVRANSHNAEAGGALAASAVAQQHSNYPVV